jgi:hypothetical protein
MIDPPQRVLPGLDLARMATDDISNWKCTPDLRWFRLSYYLVRAGEQEYSMNYGANDACFLFLDIALLSLIRPHDQQTTTMGIS